MITHPLLTRLANKGIRLGYEELALFLDAIVPGRGSLCAVQIAGTNGKGSVSRMLESIYLNAGYSVGLFTSPHLSDVNERIRINGEDISDTQFDDLITQLSSLAVEWSTRRASVEDSQDLTAPLTYFEMTTAMAVVAFYSAEVDVAIFEVGLGGRLDATNVINPVATAVVTVDYDHQDVLGEDLAQIAFEKAGVIRKDVPCVIGPMDQRALQIIRLTAHQRGAPLFCFGEEFDISREREGFFSLLKSGANPLIYNDLLVKMIGSHQQENAAVAAILAHTIRDRLPCSEQALRNGLISARHPGRMEWLGENLLVDCAHNEAGARRLAEYLRSLKSPLPITLVLGFSREKNIRTIALSFMPLASRILTTHCQHPRALSSKRVRAELPSTVPVYDIGPVEEIWPYLDLEREVVVFTGSVFLVGAIRALYQKAQQSSAELQQDG